MKRKIEWKNRARGLTAEIEDGRDWLRIDSDRLSYDGSAFFGVQLRVDGVSIGTYAAGHEDIEEAIMDVRGQLADLCAPRVVGRFNDLLSRMSTWEAAA